MTSKLTHPTHFMDNGQRLEFDRYNTLWIQCDNRNYFLKCATYRYGGSGPIIDYIIYPKRFRGIKIGSLSSEIADIDWDNFAKLHYNAPMADWLAMPWHRKKKKK